MDGVEELL